MDFLHKSCREREAYLQAQVKYLQDKCDRLTEALLKRDQHIVVSLPPAPMVEAPNVPVVAVGGVPPVMPTEAADVWGDMTRGSGHTIAGWAGKDKFRPRVEESQVPAPQNKSRR